MKGSNALLLVGFKGKIGYPDPEEVFEYMAINRPILFVAPW
jgi:hypothetical protein